MSLQYEAMNGHALHEFVALGHAGSEHYAGLETFPNPGVSQVEMTSDELAAVYPITAQPDLYVATIEYGRRRCASSRSRSSSISADTATKARSARRSRSGSATTG